MIINKSTQVQETASKLAESRLGPMKMAYEQASD
jgi:hypothetical protein